MSCTTLAMSYCWHCHSPLEHQASGIHDGFKSVALAVCPSCASEYKIVATMVALSGPALVDPHGLKSAPVSKYESGPNGRALMGTGW